MGNYLYDGLAEPQRRRHSNLTRGDLRVTNKVRDINAISVYDTWSWKNYFIQKKKKLNDNKIIRFLKIRLFFSRPVTIFFVFGGNSAFF